MAEGGTPEDIWHAINERRRLMRKNLHTGDTSLSVRSEMIRRMQVRKQHQSDEDR